jgi:uncharacterized membrane protein
MAITPLPLPSSDSSRLVSVSEAPSASGSPRGREDGVEVEEEETEKPVSFKNSRIVMGFSYLVFAVVVVANTYVIVILALGREGEV